jgi:hypothetical protein
MEQIDIYDTDTTKFEWETIWIKKCKGHRKGEDPTRYKATTKEQIKLIGDTLNNFITEELNLFSNQYIKPIFDKDSNTEINFENDMQMIRHIFGENAKIKIATRTPRMKNGKMFWSARYIVQKVRIRPNQLFDLIKFEGKIPDDYFDLSKYGKGGQFFTLFNDKKYDGDVPPLLPYNDKNANPIDYYATYVKESWENYDDLWETLQWWLAKKKEDETPIEYKDDEEVDMGKSRELEEVIKRVNPKRADHYETWMKPVFAFINYGVSSGLSRRLIEDLIHSFSKKSIAFYEEDKVDLWITNNYDRLVKSDCKNKLGRNWLINVCLKEDDFEYWCNTYRYRDYKVVLKDYSKECIKVRMGGKWLILRNEDGYNPEPYFLYDKANLKHYYENEEVMCYKTKDKDGKDTMVNIVDAMSIYWKDMTIKCYDNVIYAPCPTKDISSKYFNTWFGWECMKYDACKDDDEDVGIILKHLKEVWCDDNMELYEWWLDYLAYLVNGGRTGVVPIVRGTQGCGKDKFMSEFIMNKLLGERYCITTDDPVNHIFGRFNSGLLDKSYGVIEEGTYDLNSVYSKIKKTATSDKLSIEKKFENVANSKNYINLIISTNSNCLITGDKGMAQRRLMNIKCSDRYLGNVKYFDRYTEAIKNGGAVKAIYNMLMTRFKVKGLDPENTMYLQNTKPETKETNDVKEKSVPLTTQFLLEKLDMDIMSNGVDTRINRSTLYSKYKSWCDTRTIRCCDANSFYTNIADVDGLVPFKSNGIRFLIITIPVKEKLLELNKDDVGTDNIEEMDEWI